MFRKTRNLFNPSRVSRWCWIALMLACAAASGCAKFDLRGESFKEDEFSLMPRQFRPHEKQEESWGVSNKAIQIEKNLGY